MGAPDLLQDLRGAGFTLTPAGGGGIRVAPSGALTDEQREAIRACRAELLGLLAMAAEPRDAVNVDAVAWTDADIASFTTRRDRLMRWGWAEPEAEKLAERLVWRDREGDARVACAGDCAHFRPGRCGNHRAAALQGPELSGDLATMLQRCPGFKR